ncbi:MAG TPA: DAK2 domain-containing protein [Chloroflexia bacterium]|nr:DAK2 domain-containing protein [Chloroflexia bacterium]
MGSENGAPTQSNPDGSHEHVPTGPGEQWGGQEFKRVLSAGAVWIARNAEGINALNVFPVPDGDTGTNMALTMQAAIKQVADSPTHSVAEIASGVSRGALMGARGNSGVILSQIWRGFAERVAGHDLISAGDFAEGLVAATATAYRAVLRPVEGTILTVIKDTGEAAKEAASVLNSFSYVLAETSKAARVSVNRTPTLLDKLRDAGVVDAGGYGLWVMLDGMRRYAEGEEIEALPLETGMGSALPAEMAESGVHVEHGEYGYCTNFLLTGGGWDFDEVRARIATLGDSAVIVGDDRIVKVHIHTETPGTVLNYATTLGSLRQISIANMQDQHEEFLDMHARGAATSAAAPGAVMQDASTGATVVSGRDVLGIVAATRIGVLAVAAGSGLVEAFKSMGATAIIEGGQTMNPSTEDILKVVESVPQNEVIILPNNGNIIMSARQTETLTKKKVVVVPTDTIPQGMAALIALNFEGSLEENSKAMLAAAKAVETGELTRAVRDAKVNGMDVKAGQFIGLHNNALVTTAADLETAAWALLEHMGAAERELITIYWGGEVTEDLAEKFRGEVEEHYPDAEIELVHGGQPFYEYIISAE